MYVKFLNDLFLPTIVETHAIVEVNYDIVFADSTGKKYQVEIPNLLLISDSHPNL